MMAGSKTTNEISRAGVLAALRAIPAQQDFIWDGTNEDERPASVEEMRAAIAADQKRQSRPIGSNCSGRR